VNVYKYFGLYNLKKIELDFGIRFPSVISFDKSPRKEDIKKELLVQFKQEVSQLSPETIENLRADIENIIYKLEIISSFLDNPEEGTTKLSLRAAFEKAGAYSTFQSYEIALALGDPTWRNVRTIQACKSVTRNLQSFFIELSQNCVVVPISIEMLGLTKLDEALIKSYLVAPNGDKLYVILERLDWFSPFLNFKKISTTFLENEDQELYWYLQKTFSRCGFKEKIISPNKTDQKLEKKTSYSFLSNLDLSKTKATTMTYTGSYNPITSSTSN
jgi:hypothetical protein